MGHDGGDEAMLMRNTVILQLSTDVSLDPLMIRAGARSTADEAAKF